MRQLDLIGGGQALKVLVAACWPGRWGLLLSEAA
jgi:hypothetical protein